MPTTLFWLVAAGVAWLLIRRPGSELTYGNATAAELGAGDSYGGTEEASSQPLQSVDVTPASTVLASASPKKSGVPVVVGTPQNPFPAKSSPPLIEGLISDPTAVNATYAKGGGYSGGDTLFGTDEG